MMRLLLFILIMIPSLAQAEDKLVVVVHKDNPITQMTKSDVIGLFMGKYAAFSSGERALVVDWVDEHQNRSIFYRKLIGRSVASVNAYWSRIRFSGKRRPPVQKENHVQILAMVNTNKQVISYLPKSKLTPSLKVVFEFD